MHDRAPPEGDNRTVLSFEDNGLLARVLGQYDQHLALLEERLKLDARANGNAVELLGPRKARAIGKAVLKQLYERAARGQDIARGDVDGAIRHVRSEQPMASGQADIRTRRKIVTARTPTQNAYIQAMQRFDLVFGIGPAGTGKTYLAVAAAAAALEANQVDRIILSRPAVEAGERLGFLPGDMRDKVDPYLRPLYDSLYDVLAPEKVERDLEAGVIEVAPLAFMRGRTLANAFVILDEAQNTTSMQMKMFLTRLGENAKMVVTGDPSQIDLPSGQTSGLEEAVALLRHVDEIEAVRFQAEDVVRRDLVAHIVKAYDGAQARDRASTQAKAHPRSPRNDNEKR
ncbi:MAG: PhoH family protein [Pseudomonadota bacterium]